MLIQLDNDHLQAFRGGEPMVSRVRLSACIETFGEIATVLSLDTRINPLLIQGTA